MKYRVVFDNHALVTFEEWPAAIVCFYNRITTQINDIIEFYEHEVVIFIWVKGKGLIHKKTKPLLASP